MATTIEIPLAGCRPLPLADYLKALGVLRVVSGQLDASVRGRWVEERFVLESTCDSNHLLDFLLHRYRPTPIVAPWNGGSGFYPKDNSVAISAIEAGGAPRFAIYRQTILEARSVVERLGLSSKVTKADKLILLEACRATLPDEAVRWLDAAFTLSLDGPKYPPLLGTGGNDGRLEFTNNHMQHLLVLFDPATGEPTAVAEPQLRESLLGELSGALRTGAIGQFQPAGVGGANAGTGFDGDSLVSSWDYVFMLEGALMFAGSISRRQEVELPGGLAYPFTVRATAAGYGSAASDDERSARAEIWLPLWSRSASAAELEAMFAEGRARVGNRPVTSGVDFARAVASLGVDRGIDAFERVGFHVRNGLAYFATPLGRLPVGSSPSVLLLESIDDWLRRFQQRARGKTAPARIGQAARRLEDAVMALCERSDGMRTREVFVALGACERALAGSSAWSAEARVPPIPPLSMQWLLASDDGSRELRIAAGVASLGRGLGAVRMPWYRYNLEAADLFRRKGGTSGWRWRDHSLRDAAWVDGRLVDALNAVMLRRIRCAESSGAATFPDRGRYPVGLADVAAFLDGPFDDQSAEQMVWACSLLDWSQSPPHLGKPAEPDRDAFPGADYALLALCFGAGLALGLEIPLEPSIHRMAMSGQGTQASRAASRRLRGSGLTPLLELVRVDPARAARLAAALALPLTAPAANTLRAAVAPARDDRESSTPEEGTQP